MKRLITLIAIIAASFGIAGNAHADEPPGRCGIAGVQSIEGCILPTQQPATPPEPCVGGGGGICEDHLSTAEVPVIPVGVTANEVPPAIPVEIPADNVGAKSPKPHPVPVARPGVWDHVALAPPW